jgi:hypothetical protein
MNKNFLLSRLSKKNPDKKPGLNKNYKILFTFSSVPFLVVLPELVFAGRLERWA